MRFVFSESEVIHQKNKSIGKFGRIAYTPKPKTGKKFFKVNIAPTRPNKPLKTHCRDCGCKLKLKQSQYLGICPLCDML